MYFSEYVILCPHYNGFELSDFFGTHGLGPVKPDPRAAKPIDPPAPYVENNYRIEVKITFMLIAYLALLCEFF